MTSAGKDNQNGRRIVGSNQPTNLFPKSITSGEDAHFVTVRSLNYYMLGCGYGTDEAAQSW
jgi:hypothetical protein